MLWQHYIFGRGQELYDLWHSMYRSRTVRLLYISGRGFDLRAQAIMKAFLDECQSAAHRIEAAQLLLIDFPGYNLTPELHSLTDENAHALCSEFSRIGPSETISIRFSAGGEDDISASNALRIGAEDVLTRIAGYTDIVLDVSTMPRVVYVTLLTRLLESLIADKHAGNPLVANRINLQVLVAEDPVLDSRIQPQDPSNELILIPGFASSLQAESVKDWPLVWFPILGENRVGQLQKVIDGAIPNFAEICPVLPHPSRNPRRADQLLTEYKVPLFDARQTPTANILYAHEAHQFEAYRQLLRAMERYKRSLGLLGGCRLVITPLGSKLITLGASLACYEMRPASPKADYGIAIPYAEPKRYVVAPEEIRASLPELCSLVLTGESYTLAG